MAVTTSAGVAAWLADHPGTTIADFQAQQAAELGFAAAKAGLLPANILAPPTDPTQRVVSKSKALFAPGSAIASAGGGAASGGVAGPIGAAVGFIGGLLGGLLGGAPDPPTAKEQFISKLRDDFPDQNAPICGTPIDISDLTGGGSAFLNVPCDDPGFGSASRSTVEWFIHTQGLGTFMRAVELLLSPSPTGSPSFAQLASQTPAGAAVNITADAFSGIAAAIQAGLSDQVSAIASQTNALLGGIKDSIGSVVGTLADAAKNIFGNIGDVIKALAENIGNVIKDLAVALAKGIADLAETVAKVFKENILPILEKIGNAIIEINKFYQEHIAPILQAVQQSIKVIEGAINAIEADLHAGIKGLLALPGDISTALGGLDASLQRAAEALSNKHADVQSKITFGSTNVPSGGWLGGMVGAIAGLSTNPKTTTFKPSKETLDEPTLAEALPKLLPALNQITLDLIHGLWNMLKDPAKAGELALGVSVGLFAEMFEPFEILLFLWEVMKAPLEVVGELAEERTRELIPIHKLDPATLTEAWKRDFITAGQMDEEMLVQGYNGERSKILRDLSRFVEDSATLAEYRFRGIIADSDFASGLRILGYTDSQIEAFRTANYKLLDPSTAAQAVRRGLIDETGFKTVLSTLRYDDAQQALFADLLYQPPSPVQADQAKRKRAFLGQFAYTMQDVDTPPPDFVQQAKAAGANDDAIRALWWDSWNTLDVSAWVNLYWRGLRTYEQLTAKLTEAHIPDSLHKDLIDSLRPLIPFRTVPSMVKANIISGSEAIQILQAHGYTQYDATKLLQYATKGSTKAAATAATNTHATSLSTARSLYEEGALTEAQYRDVLQEHGLSIAQVEATVQVENVAAAAKARKQAAQDIVNEFQAGLIDVPTAQQQIASLGYTQAEQARYLKAIRTARTAKAKIPGEGDLNHMMQKSVITPDEYVAALVAGGYSPEWAQRFVTWRNAATPLPTEQPQSSPANGTGA